MSETKTKGCFRMLNRVTLQDDCIPAKIETPSYLGVMYDVLALLCDALNCAQHRYMGWLSSDPAPELRPRNDTKASWLRGICTLIPSCMLLTGISFSSSSCSMIAGGCCPTRTSGSSSPTHAMSQRATILEGWGSFTTKLYERTAALVSNQPLDPGSKPS